MIVTANDQGWVFFWGYVVDHLIINCLNPLSMGIYSKSGNIKIEIEIMSYSTIFCKYVVLAVLTLYQSYGFYPMTFKYSPQSGHRCVHFV